MTLPRLQLSVIGDEIGPSLDEMISFAHEHGLKHLDMRTVGGRNLLGMKTEEVIQISRTLEKAGIAVPTFVSPLFKWKAPGKSTNGSKVDFAFDPTQCPVEDWVAHAMQIAVILGAPHMRIFSYLRYNGFQPSDLRSLTGHLTKLLGFASHYDITLQLENEPVCNVGNIAELAAFFTAMEQASEVASEGDEEDFKERDLAANRTVPLGDGDVPWPAELKRLLGGVETKEVLASIETHCPQDGRNATARSLAGLRRIAAEIGVEVV